MNISVKLLDGNDSVSFDNSIPIDLKGKLSVNGGNGHNTVTATDLKVEKSFSITNGTNIAGTTDVTILTNLTVGGSLIIHNGDGDTQTVITRSSAGTSFISGSVAIINGSGQDITSLNDTNVGGSVTVNNGHGNAVGIAGHTWILNVSNISARSVIRGNVTVSYLDGNTDAWDGIWDTVVGGNVTFIHGPGTFTTNFDGANTNLPDVIRGNLILSGSGANTVKAGTQYYHTGLIVGKNFTMTSGAAADSVTLNKAEVDGATILNLGDGANVVRIDDSLFAGIFNLTTGAGVDQVYLDTRAGSSGPTTFERAVLIRLVAGADGVLLDDSIDANQSIVFYSTFVIHHGPEPGDFLSTPDLGKEISPFGLAIQWIL